MRIPMSWIALLLLTYTSSSMRADDGAAAVAAGGLVLMKREPRIVMAKEVLKISTTNVTVDYEFRNDSDQNITTVVAFPVPTYGLNEYAYTGVDHQTLDDFQLTIDGVPRKFSTEMRALVNGHDVTAQLQSEHIDIGSLGNFTDVTSTDLTHVAPAKRQQLAAAGIFSSGATIEEMEPQWQVQKKYYWTQTFPAHRIVRIRHSYSPGTGGGVSLPLTEIDKDSREFVSSLCIDPALKGSILKSGGASFENVDFILTTANTWKTPIEDFTLIVDRTKHDDDDRALVSFCWDGPVIKIDPNHFSAHSTNLVPGKELRIGFIHPYTAKK